MDYLPHLAKHARLAILLCLSALLHLAVLLSLPWSKTAQFAHPGSGRTLTATLRADAPRKIAPAEKPKSPPIDTRYFSMSALDPVVGAAQAPADLPGQPEQGEIILRLWIDKTGRVIRVEPVTAELAQSFIAALRAAYLNTQMMPGRRAGEAVNSVRDITLHYGSPPAQD